MKKSLLIVCMALAAPCSVSTKNKPKEWLKRHKAALIGAGVGVGVAGGAALGGAALAHYQRRPNAVKDLAEQLKKEGNRPIIVQGKTYGLEAQARVLLEHWNNKNEGEIASKLDMPSDVVHGILREHSGYSEVISDTSFLK
jgi:hypothetical protein